MKSWASPLWVTAIFLANMMSVDGQVAAQSGLCGILVTERECRAYLAQLERARTDEERIAIETEHVMLLKERARLCPGQRDIPGAMKAEVPGSRHNPQPNLQQNPPSKIWM
jgi:hypothetical protein